MEVKKHIDDVTDLCANTDDDLQEKREEVDAAIEKAKRLKALMEVGNYHIIICIIIQFVIWTMMTSLHNDDVIVQ